MLPDSKKNIKRFTPKKIWLHIGGTALIVVLGFLVVANVHIYQKKQEFIKQVADLKKQIQDIKQRNENLQEGIAKSDDSGYVEKVAREELDLQKSDEKTVSFMMPEATAPKTPASLPSPAQTWFGKFWQWLKNI